MTNGFLSGEVRKHFGRLTSDTICKWLSYNSDRFPVIGSNRFAKMYGGDIKEVIAWFAKGKYGENGKKYEWKGTGLDNFDGNTVENTVNPAESAIHIPKEPERDVLPSGDNAIRCENERLIRELRKAADWNETVKQTIEACIAARTRPLASYVPKFGGVQGASWPCAIVCQFGDWHTPKEEHLRSYMDKAEKVIRDIRCGSISEIVLSFGGDDQDGTNVYKGHAYRALHDNVEQMRMVGEFKIMLCEWAARLAPRVRALQAYGNHAAGGDKRGGPPHPLDNWDRASGFYAERATRDWVNWEFIADKKLFLQTMVGGIAVSLMHGQNIKSHFKTPYYGIDYWTMASKSYKDDKIPASAPRLVLLHHHHRLYCAYLGADCISMCGTLQPANDYVESIGGQPTPLSQVLIAIKADANPCIHGWHPIFAEA